MTASFSAASAETYEWGGHTKFRLVGQSYPDNSIFRDFAGSGSIDAIGELRLNLSAKHERWAAHADYQLIAINSEFLPLGLPNDDARAFDATGIIDESGDTAILHRLDRLWLGYTGDKTTVRIGRQALSWGNGLFFHPLDLVNPFDATAIDTEYKAGDDMLYVQYLLDNGNDVQGAAVFRRDPASGDIESDQGTVALKYHGLAGENEYDILVAEDHDDTVLGLGATRSIGGAVLRGDVVITDSSDDTTVEVVTNLSYSWIWWEKNVSGAAEYYFDGDDGHFVAGSLMVEMSPLLTLSPTLVTRSKDASNMKNLGSRNILPVKDGNEFSVTGTPCP